MMLGGARARRAYATRRSNVAAAAKAHSLPLYSITGILSAMISDVMMIDGVYEPGTAEALLRSPS